MIFGGYTLRKPQWGWGEGKPVTGRAPTASKIRVWMPPGGL